MLEIGTPGLDSLFCGLADWNYAEQRNGPASLACGGECLQRKAWSSSTSTIAVAALSWETPMCV
jgi:hypothetical protein